MTRPVTTPGRLVAGRYRLKSQIGGGGMGTVWLARDELLGREVAIKQVLSAPGVAAAEADQQRQRALREGRIAARLSHPHAISVYDVALESSQPWLVMEYLPSRSLAAVLADDGVLRVDQVAQIGAQVADALAATHAAGIVHRDVKPANILIGQGGRIEGLVKITDFGISHASGDVTLTQTGQITGTPAYLAPEVAQGREMTEASDVFSLGATLYTCIEGQPPFGMEDNALGMLHRVAGGNIVPPRRTGSLTKPLLRMLAAEPADRPSMAEVRDELATLAAGRGRDTTTVLLARTDLGSGQGRNRTAAFPAGASQAVLQRAALSLPVRLQTTPRQQGAVAEGAVAEGAVADGAVADDASAPPPVQSPTPPAPPPTLTGPAAPSTGPAAGAPAAGGAGAAAVLTPDRTPPPAPTTRRRGRILWLLVGLVALVFAGLIAFWATSLNDPEDGSNAQNSPSAATSSSASPTPTEEEPEPTGETTAAETTAQTSAAPPADPLAADSIRTFLTDYHALALQDPVAAYARTGPQLQSRISQGNYAAFWNRFTNVQVSDIQAQDGATTATGSLTFTENGRTFSEQHRFTLLVRDGQLVMDLDEQI